MAWQAQMTTMLRALLDDAAGPQARYTDDRLLHLLVAAAFQVITELDFDQDFEVDLDAFEIDPDPLDADTRDDSFVSLVVLKAACLVDRSEARTAARRSIAVRDGSSAVDTRGSMSGWLRLLEKGGWCDVYAEAKDEYVSGRVSFRGAAIMGPFHLYAASQQRRLTFE
jgi:hypothetical protein